MIQSAVQSNIPEIIRLSREFRAESSLFKSTNLNIDKLEKSLELAIQDVNEILIISAGPEGEVRGVLWASVVPLPWCDLLVSVDNFLIVKQSYRGNADAVRLIKRYEREASYLGAKAVKMSTISGINMEMTSKMYTNLGYKMSGFVHFKELDG